MTEQINDESNLNIQPSMVSVKEMTKRVKAILARHIPNRRVIDTDVADILRIKHGSFGVMKAKNKMPIDELQAFCERTGLHYDSLVTPA